MKKLAIIILLAACVGFGAYMVTSRQHTNPPVPPTPPAPNPVTQAAPQKIKIYRVVIKDNAASLEPTDVEMKSGNDPEEFALTSLFTQGESNETANPIPRGTRLLGFEIKGKMATVDLSREFKDNFSGGSESEGLAINAILLTLGQFHEIEKVKLLVEGHTAEPLENIDLSEPLDVNGIGSEYGGGN